MRRFAGGLLAVSAAALTFGLTAAPAQAHATFVGSDPAQGSVVVAMPDAVTLTFSAELAAGGASAPLVAVTAPDGNRLETIAPSVDGATVTQKIGAAPQSGSYAVSYRVFSTDGHQVRGQVRFSVGSASKPAPSSDVGDPTAGADTGAAENPEASIEVSFETPGFWARHWWQVAIGVALFTLAGAFEVAARRTKPTKPAL